MSSTRRWNSFVCPGCRFIFRVARDHDGTGVVCPACRVMLRLPAADDEVPPLVMPAREVEPRELVVEEFEDDGEGREGKDPGEMKFIASLALGAILLLGLFWWWMKPEPKSMTDSPVVVEASGDSPQEPIAREVAESRMVKVEGVVKSFLEAATVDEALEWVRDPEDTAGKMKRWLDGEPYEAPGFRGLLGEGINGSTRDDRVVQVQVRTSDYELREIALIRNEGDFLVDWESWAGWSEMSWEDFMRDKPTEPVRFRVVLSQVDYYNFDFKNDSEWSSYRLDSPAGEKVLYGYVPRTGELDLRIRPLETGSKSKLLLRLKFPAGSNSGNQVLIDSVAGEGWVDLEEAP